MKLHTVKRDTAKFYPLAQTFILVAAIAVCLGFAAPAAAQRDTAKLRKFWTDRKDPRFRISEYQTSNPSVIKIFRPIAARTRSGVVGVLSQGKPVAMGAVVRKDGYIITKASELDGRLQVVSGDRLLSAKLIGVSKPHDLAMIKVAVDDLTPVEWAGDDEPMVGSWLATPGLGEDVAAIGAMSVVSRKIQAPSGILGVLLERGDDGPVIAQVMPKSAAANAGLRVSDIVVSVDGQKVSTREQLIQKVRRYQPGDLVRLQVRREGSLVKKVAALGDRNELDPRRDRRNFQNALGGELSERRTGFPAVIQHDTVLRPIDCGGPLVNLDGKVVGINIARSGRVSSLAVPTAIVKSLLDDFIRGKLDPSTGIRAQVSQIEDVLKELKDARRKIGELVDKNLAIARNARETIDNIDEDDESQEEALARAFATRRRAERELRATEGQRQALNKQIGDFEERRTDLLRSLE